MLDCGKKTLCYTQHFEDPVEIPGQPPPTLPTLCTAPDPHGPKQPTHVQYLIKWRGRSYLHCTWESEDSLASLDIKGIKKFHNFLKKEEEREAWEKMVSPEDVEYAKCQEELGEQLLGQFTQVERVIGEALYSGFAVSTHPCTCVSIHVQYSHWYSVCVYILCISLNYIVETIK